LRDWFPTQPSSPVTMSAAEVGRRLSSVVEDEKRPLEGSVRVLRAVIVVHGVTARFDRWIKDVPRLAIDRKAMRREGALAAVVALPDIERAVDDVPVAALVHPHERVFERAILRTPLLSWGAAFVQRC
jgi:hypothetical protein